jgi:hypothetical protein
MTTICTVITSEITLAQLHSAPTQMRNDCHPPALTRCWRPLRPPLPAASPSGVTGPLPAGGTACLFTRSACRCAGEQSNTPLTRERVPATRRPPSTPLRMCAARPRWRGPAFVPEPGHLGCAHPAAGGHSFRSDQRGKMRLTAPSLTFPPSRPSASPTTDWLRPPRCPTGASCRVRRRARDDTSQAVPPEPASHVVEAVVHS